MGEWQGEGKGLGDEPSAARLPAPHFQPPHQPLTQNKHTLCMLVAGQRSPPWTERLRQLTELADDDRARAYNLICKLPAGDREEAVPHDPGFALSVIKDRLKGTEEGGRRGAVWEHAFIQSIGQRRQRVATTSSIQAPVLVTWQVGIEQVEGDYGNAGQGAGVVV